VPSLPQPSAATLLRRKAEAKICLDPIAAWLRVMEVDLPRFECARYGEHSKVDRLSDEVLDKDAVKL
jgi:hypothetical protein